MVMAVGGDTLLEILLLELSSLLALEMELLELEIRLLELELGVGGGGVGLLPEEPPPQPAIKPVIRRPRAKLMRRIQISPAIVILVNRTDDILVILKLR